MKNPLTLEEKANVPIIIDHDLIRNQEDIINQILARGTPFFPNLTNEEVDYKRQHVMDVLTSMTILSTYSKHCHFGIVSPGQLDSLLKQMKVILGKRGKISTHSNICDEFVSHKALLSTALYNLTKNSLRLANEADIRVEESRGINIRSEKIVYNPREDISRYFVKFSVHDNGPGFPKDKPLEDYLKLGVSTRKDSTVGFGLYYVNLVAKFLRAPLTIQSEPGNTKLSLYHPLDLKD